MDSHLTECEEGYALRLPFEILFTKDGALIECRVVNLETVKLN
jgi:hypothetical protein